MKKGLALFILIVLFTLVFSGIALAAGEQVLIDAPSQVNIGDTFNVVIQLGNATDLAGFSVDMVFDPSIVQVNSVTLNSSIFGSEQGRISETLNEVDNSAGTITYCAILVGSGSGVDLTTPANALTINCTAQSTEATWDITVTDSNSALSVGGNNTRVLLSDSNASKISTNMPTGSVFVHDNTNYWITTKEVDGVATVRQHYINNILVEVETYFSPSGILESNTQYDSNRYPTQKTVYLETGIKLREISYYASSSYREKVKNFRSDSTLKDIFKYANNSDNRNIQKTKYYSDGTTVYQIILYDEATGNTISVEEYNSSGIKLTNKSYYLSGNRRIVITFRVDGTAETKFGFADNSGNTQISKVRYNTDGTTPLQNLTYDSDMGFLTSVESYTSSGIIQYSKTYYSPGKRSTVTLYRDDGTLEIYYEFADNSSNQMTLRIRYQTDGNTINQRLEYDASTGILTSVEGYSISGTIEYNKTFYLSRKREIVVLYRTDGTREVHYQYANNDVNQMILRIQYQSDGNSLKQRLQYSSSSGMLSSVEEFNTSGIILSKKEFYASGNLHTQSLYREDGTLEMYYIFIDSSDKHKISRTTYHIDGTTPSQVLEYDEITEVIVVVERYNVSGALSSRKTYDNTGIQLTYSVYRSSGILKDKYIYYPDGSTVKEHQHYDESGDYLYSDFY